MFKKIKSYMMPLAMITGGLFYQYTSLLSFITPYLIALMLFITYCGISLRDIRFSRLHFFLLLIQILGSVGVYLLLAPIHIILAQGAMICILAPTATAAPVITGMLGGNTGSLTTYSLLSNITVAILAPIIFAAFGNINADSFVESMLIVSEKVFILLLLPFICALLLSRLLPRVHEIIKKNRGLSFYLWSLALVIITGKTVFFILNQENPNLLVQVALGIGAFVICVIQFLVGRKLGSKYDDTIAGGQGLGQKNTILAIWMAQTYLNPISSIGPGAYVLWQNLVNSYQVWRKRKDL
ncbi:bile acid:sodium symporter family protein [Dysgonomonas sp. ZJ709]|uniref:bile acid:sodium symporter family protein n=1 Tax=Dysgonomonas sp. ZJ709 TaxID=2709797 RepID=UPI0013E9AD67|nr:transporter [Dysgonomonas sp. ZJ709]